MKRSNIFRAGLLAAAMAFAAIGCTSQKYGSSGEQSESSLSVKGNGDSYAGKTYKYTIPVSCADGSNVASAIEVGSNGVMSLIRDNCATLSPPVVLAEGQVDRPDDGLTLIYENRVYTGPDRLPSSALSGEVECSGSNNFAPGEMTLAGRPVSTSAFELVIDRQNMTVIGQLRYYTSFQQLVWSMNVSGPLHLAGAVSGNSTRAEYYTGDESTSGFKGIFDLQRAPGDVTGDSAVFFWLGNYMYDNIEYKNIRCVYH